jgi:hypothetical protein
VAIPGYLWKRFERSYVVTELSPVNPERDTTFIGFESGKGVQHLSN